MNPKLWTTALTVSLTSAPAPADHALGGFDLGTSGPITTISATTLPRGALSGGYQVEHQAFKEFSDAELTAFALQDIDVHSLKSNTTHSLRVAYGVTDDLTVGLKLPYVSRRNLREAHFHEDEGEVELHALGDSDGIGDLTLLGQYRFFKSGGTEAAALVGVKAPTGKTDRAASTGETFEAEHLPGSGSWDGLLGAAVTRRWDSISLDANVLYTLATEGTQDTDLGDRLTYNLALSYRLGSAAHEHGPGAAPHSHLSWDLIFELNGEHQQRQTIGGVRDENSGGDVVYASPGVRLSGEGWSAYVSYGKPIVKDLNGIQHEPEYRVVAGVGLGF